MHPDLDPRILDRVRKLLAKAEHPATPPPEAEAFSVKAAALMARHLIDEAMLDAARLTTSEPEVRTIDVDPPYALARTSLLASVGRAHRVAVVILDKSRSGARRASLVGFPADIAATEVLFTSLLLQASTAMRLASVGAHSPKAFRRAFLHGYAKEIGARLAEVAAAATADQPSTTGASTALVLADRQRSVDALVRTTFPRLASKRVTVSDRGGIDAGRRAGQQAELGTVIPLPQRPAAVGSAR